MICDNKYYIRFYKIFSYKMTKQKNLVQSYKTKSVKDIYQVKQFAQPTPGTCSNCPNGFLMCLDSETALSTCCNLYGGNLQSPTTCTFS